MSNPETNSDTQNSKLSVLKICISKIRACSEFRISCFEFVILFFRDLCANPYIGKNFQQDGMFQSSVDNMCFSHPAT
jgi:hypothetical protein